MGKYNLNEIVYFVNGKEIVKGIILEKVLHWKQNGLIEMYNIRPCGFESMVSIEVKNIYDSLNDAKKVVIEDVKKNYTKDKIEIEYQLVIERLKEKYEPKIDSFDEDFLNIINHIKIL